MPKNLSKVDLHEQILAEAKKLFIRQGYHGLAMREIAEALGVSKAALYYHFKDKEELFLAILEAYLDEMKAAMDRILAEPVACAEQISRFMEYVLAQPSEQRSIIRLASQEMSQLSASAQMRFGKVYQEKFIGRVEALLKEGMQKGEFKRMDSEVATWALLGMMYPYFYPTHGGETGLPEQTVREITAIFLTGLGQSSSSS